MRRFTDTDKWNDPWFRKLPILYKSLWEYLRDRVDNAGFWKVDHEAAFFHINEEYDPEEALRLLNEGKVRVIAYEEYWQLPDFVMFQNGVLTEACKPHRQIINLLEKYKNKGYGKGMNTLQEKDKDKERDKDKEGKEREKGEEYSQAFNDFWIAYPSRHGKKVLKKQAFKEFLKLREEDIPELMLAVKNYSDSKQYPKDPPRFFKDEYWREWLTPARFPEKDSVSCETPDRTTQRFSSQAPAEFKALVGKIAAEKSVR